MEEYTNSPEIDDGENLFTDDEPTSEAEEKAEQPEQENAEPEKPKQEEAPAKAEGTIKIKYNHEEKEISLEEAATLAQKGMNYDKLQGELDKYKNSKERQLLEHYAKTSGMTYEEYIGYLDKQRDAAIVQNEIKDIKAKHPDVSDDLAHEIAEMRAEKKRADIERARADEEKSKKDAEMKPWIDFATKYPDKAGQPLPPEVLASISEGKTPIEAMLEYERAQKDKEIEELKLKLETQDKNKKNKEKAIGSVSSTVGDPPVDDPFLRGFNGG